MPHINLLNWRESQRNEKKKEYLTVLAAVALCSFAVCYGVKLNYDAQIEGQNARNELLQREIAVLDQKIVEIRELNKLKASLQQRMKLIEQLQSSRNLGTQIFDEIVKVTPGGVYLTKLEKKANFLQLSGKSESNNRLAHMVRKVEDSYLLSQPDLRQIVAGDQQPALLSNFTMQLKVKSFDELSVEKVK